MDELAKKREISESLIAKMDELLPPIAFKRPSFTIPEEVPIVPVAAALVNEIEPVLESVEAQLKQISASRGSLKTIERELSLLRSKQ